MLILHYTLYSQALPPGIFIERATQLIRNSFSPYLSDSLIDKHLFLNKTKSKVLELNAEKDIPLPDHKGLADICSGYFVYDCIYKTDTVFSVGFNVSDSFTIEDNTYGTYAFELLYWENEFMNRLYYNYDSVRNYVRSDTELQRLNLQIYLYRAEKPNIVMANGKHFIEIELRWLITVTEPEKRTKEGRQYQDSYVRIEIDAKTGRKIYRILYRFDD